MTLKQKIFIGCLSLNLINMAFAGDTSIRNEPANMEYGEMDKILLDGDKKYPNAAHKEFYYAFNEAQNLITKGNLEHARRAIANLHKVKTYNKYEESRVYLMDYWYQGKLGDKEKETEALIKLIPIAYGNIDSDTFVEAGIRLFKRQYNAQDYGSAIDTLNYLRKEPSSKTELDAIAPAVKKLDNIANVNQDVIQQIKVDNNGKWNAKLLKHIFYIDKINGEVSSIDFECENKTASIHYQPDSVMSTPADWGTCVVKINATPNTTFHFIQLNKNPKA